MPSTFIAGVFTGPFSGFTSPDVETRFEQQYINGRWSMYAQQIFGKLVGR